MIKGSFGVKLFSDRDILLVENHRLVHYGKGTRGKSTYNEKTQIYFFIQDKYLCQEINDPYYVIEVIELSTIPIYHFSDTVISNNINSHKSAERRKFKCWDLL